MGRQFLGLAEQLGYSRESVYLNECASTNDILKTLAAGGAPDLTAALAGCQTGGKGRLRRAWSSPPGKGIYLSVLIRPDTGRAHTQLLPLMTALAVCGGLCDLGVDAAIKWPNDIVAGGKKLCGILLEGGFSQDGTPYAVAGMGINVNQDENDFTEPELANATSLKLLGASAGYTDALRAVMTAFLSEYGTFLRSPKGTQERYLRRCLTVGRDVMVTGDGGRYEARAIGVADDGALIIERNGQQTRIYAADVSVRGVMGYV